MSKRLAVIIPISLHDKPYTTFINNHYSAYNQIIGSRCFDVVELNCNEKVSVDCYVDDEGMINGTSINEYWLRAYNSGLSNSPLFGIGVITMTDLETGESTETDLELVRQTLAMYGFTPDELSLPPAYKEVNKK